MAPSPAVALPQLIYSVPLGEKTSPESAVTTLSFPPPPRTTSATLPIFVRRKFSHGCCIDVFGTLPPPVQVDPLALNVLPRPAFQIHHIPKVKAIPRFARRKKLAGKCFQSA